MGLIIQRRQNEHFLQIQHYHSPLPGNFITPHYYGIIVSMQYGHLYFLQTI